MNARRTAVRSGGLIALVVLLVWLAWAFNRSLVQHRMELALVAAAKAGDLARGRRLLADGADPNATETAASVGPLALLRHWWRRRTDETDQPRSILFWAVARGHFAFVDLLLVHGADPNRGSPYSGMPLDEAASRGYPQVMEALLAHGARIDGDEGFLALWRAAIQGKTDAIRVLVEHGLQLNREGVDRRGMRFSWGAEALILAVTHDYKETVRYLLAAGADPNGKVRTRRTALQYARIGQQGEIVKLLIAAGEKN